MDHSDSKNPCAAFIPDNLTSAKPHRNFSLYGAVHSLEANLIEQALEETGGSVTKAAKLLGLKHQTFIAMLQTRHKGLQPKRRPAGRRLKSIIKDPSKE